ncbi:MAG: tetratricopeptide repeat protein [Candidatus Omnitrophota bacterium]|jgi:tetratricopeptide (TPR) repeat protein
MSRPDHSLKKSPKIFFVIVSGLAFLVFYNAYLVDRSNLNLRAALAKVSKKVKTAEDFQRIKPLLRLPLLDEVSRSNTSAKNLIYLEMTEDIAGSPRALEQLDEMAFYLQAVIEARAAGKNIVLSILDRLNSYIYTPRVKISESRLIAKAKILSARTGPKQEKAAAQRRYYDSGNVYLELKDLPSAETAFRKAIELDPSSNLGLKAKFNLAWAHKYLESYDRATAYFDEIYNRYPERAIGILSQYEVASIFSKRGEYLRARDKYARLAEYYPEFEAADLGLFNAGYISFYNLNDAQAASLYFTQLEARFPAQGIVKRLAAKIREAMVTPYARKGYELLEERNYRQAIAAFEKALEVAPSDGRLQAGIGLGLYWQNEKELAVEKAKKAAELSPDDEVALVNSSFIFINSGKTGEAIKLGEKALNRDAAKRPELYYNLGYAYILNAQMQEAASNLERTIAINPDFIFAYNNLGCSLWAVKDYAKAIRRFKEAIAIEPDYTDAHFNLGIVYFYLNQLEKAYQEFKKVTEIEPDYKGTGEYLRVIAEILNYKP